MYLFIYVLLLYLKVIILLLIILSYYCLLIHVFITVHIELHTV